MRRQHNIPLSPEFLAEAQQIGARLARLRIARHVSQTEAALRSGLSRNTAYRLEKGDPTVSLAQLMRYLDAVAPGTNLQKFLTEDDPAIAALVERERKKRVRPLSQREIEDLNF